MSLKVPKTHDIQALESWFQQRQRALPWRSDRDPYKIWISEIMLQQTTTAAVIPYFERFMKRFPKVENLAEASIEEVYELWTGLGYYSRARNIHNAAQFFAQNGFPKDYKELLLVPGIGPYASRAISSQAFGQKVGVVDGNVIRVYARLFEFNEPWWNRKAQVEIQNWSDQVAQLADNPSESNQALMELGATVCTPKSPTCAFCPWSKNCAAFKAGTQDQFPIKKPKRAKEVWLWQPEVYISKNKILLVHTAKSKITASRKTSLPLFLQDKWVLPGKSQLLKTKPKTFDYKHNITHHEIYVDIQTLDQKPTLDPQQEQKLVVLNKVQEISPFSLVHKAIQHIINL